jgi:predicted DCC family thiol-disulfide oxidoreductase YuxK
MKNPDNIYVVYDGQCPLCRNYCMFIRIRDAVGVLELVDARQPSALVDEITRQGLNLDEGLVVQIGATGEVFHGHDAIHKLAMLSTRSGVFNRISHWIFKSKKRTLILYPFFRSFRNLTLWVLRIPLIKNLDEKCSKS